MKGTSDAKIVTVTNIMIKETKEDQVQASAARELGLLVLSIYTDIGTMCITSGAVHKAQRIQLKN